MTSKETYTARTEGMPMVLFDHQLFAYQRYGGASKYFAMLLAHLPREVWRTSTVWSNNAYVDALHLFPHRHFLPKRFFRGQGRIMHELTKPHSRKVLRQGDFDVFHQTHFETYCLEPLGDKPMVTTFHDINFSTLNPNPKIVRMQTESLRGADHVIAISENTRRDLLRLFDIPAKKVSVIHHGIDFPPADEAPAPIFPFPYLLYVGSRDAHKNFSRFLRAYAMYHEKHPDVRLVCTWRPFTEAEQQQIRTLGLADTVMHISADEEQMKSLYANALALVFPSLYEGFGMPILEAMVRHCPVVLANASCFPEIAADAGLYFDPLSEEDMADKLAEITTNDGLRASLIEQGYQRAGLFSWQKCADLHLDVYKSLMK